MATRCCQKVMSITFLFHHRYLKRKNSLTSLVFIKMSTTLPALPVRRAQGLAGLDPEPGPDQPLCPGRQLLHQHRHLLLEGWKVLGHHADHDEDQGASRWRRCHDHRRREGQALQGHHRGDGQERPGSDQQRQPDWIGMLSKEQVPYCTQKPRAGVMNNL